MALLTSRQVRIGIALVTLGAVGLMPFSVDAQAGLPRVRGDVSFMPAPSVVSSLFAPPGITVVLQTDGDGGMLRSTAKTYQLGAAANFQLQETAPGTSSDGKPGQVQFVGMVQFAPGNPQAGQIGNCTENRCGSSALIITSATPWGTTSYRLHNIAITQVNLGSPVTAAFSFDGIDSKEHGPDGPSPMMSLNDESSAPPLPTFGVFVTAQGAKGKPASLGLASVFQLQGIPAADNPASSVGQKPGVAASGAIQFAADGQQGPAINSCFLKACSATLTIRNATTQGATVYILHNVRFTQVTIAPMVTVSFTYSDVEWQTFAPNSKKPAQTGTWDYLGGKP